MVNFIQLVRNENMKLYLRPRTWVMAGIVVALVILISVAWQLLTESTPSMWKVSLTEASVLFLLVTIFTVVIAAGSVAEEFTSGTIKLLLIRPWSRSKILLSKYIAILMYAVFLAIILLISTVVVNYLCFGIHSSMDMLEKEFQASYNNRLPISYLLQYYGLTLITLVVTVTLAFMLSTVFRSSGLAIGFSLFLVLGVNSFVVFIAMLDYKWIDYLLFVHLNLTQYLDGFQMRDGMTLGYSLSVLAVYYVVFVAITWFVFNKRDVAA